MSVKSLLALHVRGCRSVDTPKKSPAGKTDRGIFVSRNINQLLMRANESGLPPGNYAVRIAGVKEIYRGFQQIHGILGVMHPT